MKDVTARVKGVSLVNHNVYQVTLVVDQVSFVAGQYLMLQLPTGESVPYSIGSAPHQLPEIQLYILVADQTVLACKVIDHLKQNKEVQVKIAGGDCHLENGVLDESLDHILLIAGGTGFAQMKSMFDSLVHKGYRGNMTLYWGLRTPKDIFLQEWIDHAVEEHKIQVEVIVNEPDEQWQGRHGWLYEMIRQDHPDLSNSMAFISGSAGMVYGTMDHLEKNGLSDKQCFSDVFAYAPRPEKPEL